MDYACSLWKRGDKEVWFYGLLPECKALALHWKAGESKVDQMFEVSGTLMVTRVKEVNHIFSLSSSSVWVTWGKTGIRDRHKRQADTQNRRYLSPWAQLPVWTECDYAPILAPCCVSSPSSKLAFLRLSQERLCLFGAGWGEHQPLESSQLSQGRQCHPPSVSSTGVHTAEMCFIFSPS